jgi:hypothetical protein
MRTSTAEQAIANLHWKLAVPMLRDIDATTEPHPIKTAHVLEQLDQSATSSGPANETIMKANRKEFW